MEGQLINPLKFRIKEVKKTGEYHVTMSSSQPIDDIVEQLKIIFELEMLTADLQTNRKGILGISFKTKNKERVAMIKKVMIDAHFRSIGRGEDLN